MCFYARRPNQLHELLAVARQFRLSDARDRRKVLERRGLTLRHVPQARIVEDDVRRHPRFVGKAFAQRAQGLEQRVVAVSCYDCLRLPAVREQA